MKHELKIQIEIERYKKYRTLLRMTESELQKYTAGQKKAVLSRDYKTILFGEDYEDDEDSWMYKITKIIFSDFIPAESVIRSSGTSIYGDISEKKDGSVIGWVEKREAAASEYDVEQNGLEYILHIDGNGKVYAPADSTELFSYCVEVEEIEFGDAFDTSDVVSMSAMFRSCVALKSLDVSGFNTENVTNMSYMFSDCSSSLTELDVSNFTTENVTDMQGMFCDCYSLRKLDISSFNTKNVTNMWSMFCGCSDLQELDVSNFNTEKVTNMGSMFFCCESLEELDVRGFNTQNVFSMCGMFENCRSLKILDTSGFDMQNVTNMVDMFEQCPGLNKSSNQLPAEANLLEKSSGAKVCEESLEVLKKLEIPEKKKNVLDKNFREILFGDSTMKWTAIGKIIFSDSIPADAMERSAAKLTGPLPGMEAPVFSNFYVDLSENRNSSIMAWAERMKSEGYMSRYALHICGDGKICAPMDCSGLFDGCFSVKTIEFGDVFDTSQVTDMSNMFYQCMALKTLDLSGFDMHKVRSMFGMFAHCENLEKLKLGRTGWRAYWGRFWIQTADLSYMFWYCESLKELDLSRFHTGKAGKMEGMFGKCSSLQELDLKRFNTKGVTDMSCMFCGCESLRKIEMSETFDTQSVTNMEEMFKDCKMLKNLDVSHFDTQNVTDMTSMFENCQSIKILDISHFNMQNVTNAEKMFSGCENLDRLPLARKLFEEKEYAAAIETLEEGNDSENAEAQYLLGVCYQNIAEYLQVYGKEFKPVQDFLRICHPNRLDDETLAEMVLKHFEAAAVRGYAPAQVQLGDFCYEGKGTEQDYEKAYEWYQKAAAQGADVDQERLKIAERKSRKGVLDMLKGWLKRS